MTAALALALTLWGAADPPVVAVEAPTPLLRGALALALVDDGAVAVPSRDDAGVLLRVLADGEGLQLATIGASERAGTVAPGTPALMELEAVHRGLALVRATPARATTPPAALFLDVDDRALAEPGPDARLAELLASALLDAGAPLADARVAAERLCVVATAAELVLSWGSTAAHCDGRQMGVARAGMSPDAVIGDALRLRDAAAPARPWRVAGAAEPAVAPVTSSSVAPLAPPAHEQPAAPVAELPSVAAPAAMAAPPTSAAVSPPPAPPTGAPVAPVRDDPSAAPAGVVAGAARGAPPGGVAPSLDLRVGAFGRPMAVDPVIEAAMVWPLWMPLGVGPAAWLAASGALDPLPLAEVALAGGLGGAWRILDDVHASASVVAGGFAHGWSYAAGDAGIAFDAIVAAPLALSWRPGPVGVSLGVSPGAMTRARSHQIQGEVAWQRGALFLGITAGLTWDIPAGRDAVEKSPAMPRGDSDG